MKSLKEQLYQACIDFVKDKEETILKSIQSNREALNLETKSSAGDKHETGRAMLQLEMEKASQQLEVVHQMKTILQRIDIVNSTTTAKLGSLVSTDNANYFLSISAGELKIGDTIYYAVSTSSPIGKLLLGKQTSDIVTFKKQITITAII